VSPDQDPLIRSLDLTRRMLKQARAGQWEQVQQTDGERQPPLRAAIAQVQGPDTSHLAAGLRELLTLNEAIAALARQARADCAAQVVSLDRGRRARRAYGRQT
jgi:hypothetical protein